jgi:enoyl-CoA hydratase
MISLAVEGQITVLELAHGKANALDLELMEALVARLDEVERSTARALVLRGSGRIFSAGVDLVRLLDGGPGYVDAFVRSLGVGLERLFAFPRPVIAAVNGHAIAGGCVLAAAADRRLMADGKGRIGIPELKVGVPFPSEPLEVMRFAVPATVERLVYGGATLLPREALQIGLVDEVVPAEELDARALRVAGSMAAIEPSAFRLSKRALRAPALERMRRERDDDEVRRCWSSAETLGAIRRYVEATLGK